MLCHDDDRTWIKSQLAMLPVQLRQKARDSYSAVYGTPENLFEECRRRTEANTRLREYVEAVAKKVAREST